MLSSTNITLYELIRLLTLNSFITYQKKHESFYKWTVFTILIVILLSITTYIIFTIANKYVILFKFNMDVESSKEGASNVYANTLDTKPNTQLVYPEIPIIPIVNNISPDLISQLFKSFRHKHLSPQTQIFSTPSIGGTRIINLSPLSTTADINNIQTFKQRVQPENPFVSMKALANPN